MAEKGSSYKARDAGGAARPAGQTAAHESAGGVGVRGPVATGLGIIALFCGGFPGWAALDNPLVLVVRQRICLDQRWNQ